MKKEHLYYILAAIPVLLIPFMGTTWLIFSIYLVLLANKSGLSKIRWHPSRGFIFKLFLIFLVSGLVLEVLAIIDNLPLLPGDRILLHPDPLTDLYLAIGYYAGFALVWSVVVSKIRFSHRDVFILGGTFGILFEQTGKLLFTLQIPAWFYVFLVYGSFQAIPLVIASEYLENLDRKDIGTGMKILVGIAVEIGCILLAALFLWILKYPLSI